MTSTPVTGGFRCDECGVVWQDSHYCPAQRERDEMAARAQNPVTDSCRVRAYLRRLPNGAYADLNIGIRGWECSAGPLLPCLLGVTKEAVEKAAPFGAYRWKPSWANHYKQSGWWYVKDASKQPAPANIDALPLPDLLARLSTQECPDADCHDGLITVADDLGRSARAKHEACSGTGRVGTCCSVHAELVTPLACSGEDCPLREADSPTHHRIKLSDGRRWYHAPRLEAASLPPTDPVLVDSLGLGAT